MRWLESIRLLTAEGVSDFVEVGAGGVLTGLLRTIDPNLKGRRFGEAADAVAALKLPAQQQRSC
ncbi:MAG: hypothetical protein WD696_01580 [Bryobacteraceae bacterium]